MSNNSNCSSIYSDIIVDPDRQTLQDGKAIIFNEHISDCESKSNQYFQTPINNVCPLSLTAKDAITGQQTTIYPTENDEKICSEKINSPNTPQPSPKNKSTNPYLVIGGMVVFAIIIGSGFLIYQSYNDKKITSLKKF